MSESAKELLISSLRKTDEAIKRLQEKQNQDVVDYVQLTYGIKKGDKIFLNGLGVLITEIKPDTDRRKISMIYQKINYNGSVNTLRFTTQINSNIKIELL